MIKVGVVGFGLRAGGIYKILKEVDPEFCLGGIVDPDEKRVRQELPENERNVDFYSDIAGLAGRGKVDALLIGTASAPDFPVMPTCQFSTAGDSAL